MLPSRRLEPLAGGATRTREQAHAGRTAGQRRGLAAHPLNAFSRRVEGGARFSGKAEVASRGDGVLVRRQEAELPAVLRGLVLDPVLDVRARERARGTNPMKPKTIFRPFRLR